nr:hypothetical protein [Tanacetum cinerariifolium]
MAFSIILISLDSLDESVGTSTTRVILFGTILIEILATVPTIDPPIVHDDTLLIPTKTPTIPPIALTLPYTSLFLYTDSSDNDSSYTQSSPTHDLPYTSPFLHTDSPDKDSSDTPSSPTHDLPSTEITPPIRIQRVIPPSDHFLPDDSLSDSSSRSSSRYLSDTSSGRCLIDSTFDTPAATSAGPSCKRCRSLIASVSLTTPVPGIFSPMRVDLLPPCKKTRDINAGITTTDVVRVRETAIGVKVGNRIKRENEDEEVAESSDSGTIEIRVDKVVKPMVSEDTLAPTDDKGSMEVVQIGLDVIMQELYDHMAEIHVCRMVEIEREQAYYRRMVVIACTDITKITRKEPKPDKNGHENGKNGKLCGGTEDFSSVSGNNALRHTLDRMCTDIRINLSRRPRLTLRSPLVKGNQEKDKIGTKPDKNRKRGEAEEIQKQLQ